MRYSHISVAIPMLAESENMPRLLDSLKKQTFNGFHVYCCINNPEGWSESSDAEQRAQWLDNQATLACLNDFRRQGQPFGISIIDRSSKGCGWQGKQRGVGWARKVLLEAIAAERDDNEAVISLDADTGFGERYMESVLNALNAHPHHSALAVPYRHPLTGEETNDRAMLRYEIYMRHYLINLLGIKERLRQNGSCADMPYAFTALGSAMAFPLWAYRRVGGYTPLQGGEDFYLMQKFAKTGSILLENNEMVYPQGRASLRVPFGTGPAIAKGVAAMNESYPIYPHEGFEAIEATYSLFPKLFEKDMATPMTAFLHEQLRTDDLWQPLRKNFKTKTLFVHASQERVDGLRMLQFLKTLPHRPAETELQHFCKTHGINIPEGLSFLNSPISDINTLRDALFHLECEKRRQHSIPAETRNV